jgi:predicted RNA-binding protein with PUA-like domain
VKYKRQLDKPVSLEQMKKEKSFKNWELLRISRLSVMPVPKTIWDKIISLSKSKF